MTDPLHPSVDDALETWARRVRADREQVNRCREVDDPADFYAPVTSRFRMDPRRTDDATLNVLLSLARPEDVWLDIGSGAGRYALPLALVVREVVAVDPSTAMLSALREDAASEGIENIRAVEGRWPLEDEPPAGDVALVAHVGYDIEEIGPFLDALEAVASRMIVAVMGESAMTTVATLFWHSVHGEPRVRLPALPELLVLLTARGALPEIRLVDRTPPTFGALSEAHAMARRQLWLRNGSARDRRLHDLVAETVIERNGRYAFEWTRTRIGIVTWYPKPRGSS